MNTILLFVFKQISLLTKSSSSRAKQVKWYKRLYEQKAYKNL